MQLKDNITPAVLTAATGLLTPFCPDLSPRSLVKALRAYQNDTAADAPKKAEKPMTRKAVAELLGCSLQTVNRYLNQGKLRRIVLSPRSVRIDPASVEALLAGEATTANGEG